ncbi:MAG: hypothetical protein M1822_009496 [Bathelium mastoideum]|nr:MAG: hypothetical protein M1822_009496 [Bathelium mastoideum]
MVPQKQPDEYPQFDDLPQVPGMLHGCAWGIFDKDGKRDNLGTLNYLTPEVVLRAREEIQKGISVSLNLPLQDLTHPPATRPTLTHSITSLLPHGFHGYDDHLSFNTQTSSQWDGLKHYAHSASGQFYNGLPFNSVPHTEDNGIHHWHARGGLVARAVLIDYVAYAARHFPDSYSPTSAHAISVTALQDVAAEQGTRFLPGDVLLVRTGLVRWYKHASPAEREEKLQPEGGALACAGVEGSEATLRWLWNGRFAAVAGDGMGWEVVPPKKGEGDRAFLHEWLLPMWGMPIGEWWDLEELSAVCEREGRWSFFLTSAPLNVLGGVASPPNALAIF